MVENMKKRKKYLVTADGSEAFACSLVTNPAISELFVAFNEQEPIKTQFSDDAKHIVVGAVAIPNYEIYRRDDNGNEYDLVFSEEAIEKMSRDFLKNYRQKDVTLQHQEEADGIWLVEQWIKTDMVYDKSLALGLSNTLPKGTWFQAYYVDSNEVWERVQSGELRGFSLECALGLEEFSKQINNDMNLEQMKNIGLFDEIKQAFKEALQEEKLSRQPKEATVEELQKEIENVDENIKVEEVALEEQVAAVTEVIETPNVEEPQVTVEEVVVEETTEETPKVEEPKADEPNPLNELVNNLKSEIDALRKMNDDLQHKIDDMGKQPSTTPINTNVSNASHTNDAYMNWRSQMQKML